MQDDCIKKCNLLKIQYEESLKKITFLEIENKFLKNEILELKSENKESIKNIQKTLENMENVADELYTYTPLLSYVNIIARNITAYLPYSVPTLENFNEIENAIIKK